MTLSPLVAEGLRGLQVQSVLWVPFAFVVALLLAVDLGLLQRTPREPTTKEALAWSAVWLALASAFGLGVFALRGAARGVEFFTGYLVEQALSVDNLFVILLVFTQLRVPRSLQRRVLVWGILGAVVLRGALVFAGSSLVARFHAVTYAFGALLVYAAWKLLGEVRRGDAASVPEETPGAARLRRWISRIVPVTDSFHGGRFTVVLGGVRHVTPLLLAVVTIELADAVFALDSIPAVFGVTSDPFIVLTSNLFAVLGLRAMFFALSGLLDELAYLKHGLVGVLLVVGAKMLFGWLWAPPAWVTLALVLLILGVAVAASLVRKRTLEGKKDHHVVRP
jgi:tellurite resistance protein TerC